MTDRIKMQMPRTEEGTPIKSVDFAGIEKTKEFLKQPIYESAKVKTSETGSNSLRVNEKGAMEIVRKDLLKTYEPEKKPTWVEQEIPFPKDQPVSIKEQTAKKPSGGAWKLVKEVLQWGGRKLFITTGALTLASTPAKGETGAAEKTFTNNTNAIEHVNTDPGGGRKVKEVPPGYTFSHSDGKKTYYKKLVGGSSGELPPAMPGNGEGDAEYKNWLKRMLKSGKYTAEQFAKMHYITDEAIEEYKKYYVPPQEDIVYTEPEESKKEDPFSAYAKDGESLWGTNRHLIGILSVPVRDTKSITESGNINTSNSEHMVLLRYVDKMGDLTGEGVEIKTGDIQKYFGTTMTLQSDELTKELKGMVKKSKTYVATAEDFAKTNK